MTCYLRHLKGIFEKANIEVTRDNKKAIDRVIHSLVEVEYKNCSSTWNAVKNKITEDEAGFVAELERAWSTRGAP